MKKNYLLQPIFLLIFFNRAAARTDFKKIIISKAAVPDEVAIANAGISFQGARIYIRDLKKSTPCCR